MTFNEALDAWIEGDPDYADEHENGQLRLGSPDEQRPLLLLPDDQIPSAGLRD